MVENKNKIPIKTVGVGLCGEGCLQLTTADLSGSIRKQTNCWLTHANVESIRSPTHACTHTHRTCTLKLTEGKGSFQMTINPSLSSYRSKFSKAAFHLVSSSLAFLHLESCHIISIWLRSNCRSFNAFSN